jgi:DNA replication and repair protein RecF
MSISQLHIHSLRNIQHAKLSLHPTFNIVCGLNGSGKTSFLEACYLLSAGYSFKTRETQPLVRYGDSAVTVFARTYSDDAISISKMISGPTQVKLNNQACQQSSLLAKFLPCQVMYQDIFHIIDAGPSVRRSVLDWGVFHVKHEYHDVWRKYRQVLKQRNALLRQHPSPKEMRPWNMQMAALASELDAYRQSYYQEWATTFQYYLAQLSDVDCRIEYYRGWRERSNDLEALLEEQLHSDCQRQYTQSGAHQADIRIQTTHANAKQGLSRGQQKIILIALKLAQGHLLNRDCLYLLDDVTSELDVTHVERLLICLQQMSGQKIITTLDNSPSLSAQYPIDCYQFNMKDGGIELM